MAASLDFTSVNTCSGGNHHNVEVTLTVDGVARSKIFMVDTEKLLGRLTEDEVEDFMKVVLRIYRAQNPQNLRNATLNKVLDLSV